MYTKIIKNTISNYGLKSVQLLLNLISIPILIESFGQEGFGIIIFASMIVGYFSVLELGISASVTKYVAQYMALKEHSRLNNIINTSLSLFIGIGFSIAVLIIIWVLLGGISWLDINQEFSNDYKNIFILSGFIALISWPQILLKSIFKGLQEFVFLNLTLSFGRVISVSLALYATLYTNFNIVYIFLFFNLDKILLTFWYYLTLKKKLTFCSFSFFSFNKKTFKYIFNFSGWIMLGQLAVLLEYQADQLIIIKFLSLSDIAVYAVIFYLFRLIQQISGLSASAVMPAISHLNETGDKDKLKEFIFELVKFHNIIFAPVAIVVFFIAEPFILLWMGPDYLKYLFLIKLSVVFQLIWQSSAMLGQIYVGLGFSKKMGIAAILIGVSNVILSCILVNFIGITGVVLGTIVVGTLSAPIAVSWYLKDLKIKSKDYFSLIFIKTQGPLLLASSVLFFFKGLILTIDSWLILIFISLLILTYLLTFTFFFIINKEEKKKLKQKLITLIK